MVHNNPADNDNKDAEENCETGIGEKLESCKVVPPVGTKGRISVDKYQSKK